MRRLRRTLGKGSLVVLILSEVFAQALVTPLQSLTAEIQKAEANWRDPGWSRVLAHRRITDAVTEYVTHELNREPSPAAALERSLRMAIHAGMSGSWADDPARVFSCRSGTLRIWVVAFVLDEAASGSNSVIQVYRPRNGVWALATQGGSEMDAVDMHVLLLPPLQNEVRLFAYGNIFGANQAPSKGILYSISDTQVQPIWKMKDTLGLRANFREGKLTVSYRDPKLFYARHLPDAFEDIYAQTADGLSLVTHKPLPADQQ